MLRPSRLFEKNRMVLSPMFLESFASSPHWRLIIFIPMPVKTACDLGSAASEGAQILSARCDGAPSRSMP